MAETKKKKPKFRFPPAANRCVKEIVSKGKFHRASFRNTIERSKKSPSGKTIIMVGCPLFVKGRGMAKAHPTRWVVGPSAVKSKTQCRWSSGPKEGQKAGMRAHIIIEPTGKTGRCRAGYEKAVAKAAGSRRKAKR